MEMVLRDPKLPVIRTPRLVLRDIRVSDISQEYIDWLNDPEVNQFLEIRFAKQTRETVENYVRARLENTRDSKHFGVYDQNDKRLVGTVTFPVINWHHLFADLSFVIGHPDARGQGYATEAVHAALYHMFRDCGMFYIWAGYYEGHMASAKVLEKNGFQVEGRFRKKRINAEGIRVDNILTGLMHEDFHPNSEWIGTLPPMIVPE
jgi:RimJ/RimL family protein N-acetyltransferase